MPPRQTLDPCAPSVGAHRPADSLDGSERSGHEPPLAVHLNNWIDDGSKEDRKIMYSP
jgi:hypothetical protein